MPVNFSVRLGPGATQFHVLSWGTCPALRTLDVERLIVALRRFVGDHGDGPAGTVRTDFAAAVKDGAAVLVHREARERLVKDERALRRNGLSVLEAPYADIDLERAELVVTDPAVAVDDAALDELRSLTAPARRADPAVAAGRYSVAGVVLAGPSGGRELPRPQAAFRLIQRLVRPIDDEAAANALASLGGFTERVVVVQEENGEETRKRVLRIGAALP